MVRLLVMPWETPQAIRWVKNCSFCTRSRGPCNVTWDGVPSYESISPGRA